MDLGQIVPRSRCLLQTLDVGAHDQLIAFDREDQRHVHADALGDDLGDGRDARFGCRDLDQQVGTIDDLPQLHRLCDRLVGIVGEPGIDLDRHPAIDALGRLVLRGEHVTGVAHVVRGDRADGGIHIGAAGGQLVDLIVVGVALGQCRLENRRVGGDTHHRLGGDQFGEVAGLDAGAREIVEPDRDAGLGQCGKIGVLFAHFALQFKCCADLSWFLRPNARRRR